MKELKTKAIIPFASGVEHTMHRYCFLTWTKCDALWVLLLFRLVPSNLIFFLSREFGGGRGNKKSHKGTFVVLSTFTLTLSISSSLSGLCVRICSVNVCRYVKDISNLPSGSESRECSCYIRAALPYLPSCSHCNQLMPKEWFCNKITDVS